MKNNFNQHARNRIGKMPHKIGIAGALIVAGIFIVVVFVLFFFRIDSSNDNLFQKIFRK